MQNKNENLINKIFLIALPTIFIIVLAVVLITVFKPFDYRKISQLKDTTVSNCLNENYNAANKQKNYYVLFYNDNDADNSLIEETVLKYANYAKGNKDAYKIFTLEVSEQDIQELTQKVNTITSLDNLPLLIEVKDGAVNNRYSTISKICSTLEDKINSLESSSNK